MENYGKSEQIICAAKNCGIYIEPEYFNKYTDKIKAHEGIIYIDKENNCLIKAKTPVFYFHEKETFKNILLGYILHNIYFPNTKYTFLGVTKRLGKSCYVLQQDFIDSQRPAEPNETSVYFMERGFRKVKTAKLHFEDDDVVIYDVTEHDNVLLGKDGKIYVVDPIVYPKKQITEIINKYLDDEFIRNEVNKILPMFEQLHVDISDINI